ncbi:Bax inhibitor-1/YccA family protein [Paenibacillus eucommiae]|uniref:Modulator of FtsH protease n=1 Tax=Paenibacillus eucommiae TaxID=1355755 RepID=A0ABS4J5T5_9BACL|nr:Bax inhibitor-1/YccA family protein [Paenibacillus eucommiae]MBP1994621.1 modulator of FtsH protease [Paenibacillus eucommiae]
MSYGQNDTITGGVERVYNTSFHKLLRMFTLSILVSFIGTYVGMEFVPVEWIIPLVIVEFIMLISAFFIRRSKGRSVGYLFVYAFCFISGITIFPSVMHYANVGGSGLISTAFIVTTVIFGGLTLYAYYSKRDFTFLGGFLMVGLLTLIGFSLVGMFIGGFGSTLGLMIAIGGVLIFSGFILYDISQYRHGLADEAIPMAVLSLYLSFINLFLYILRLLGFSRD